MSRTSLDRYPAAHVPSADPASGNKGLKDVGAAPSRSRYRTFRVIAAIMAVSGVAFGLFTAVFGIVSEAQPAALSTGHSAKRTP